MNAPTDIPVTGGLPDVAAAMPDVQGSHDDRRLVIERVGIRGVRHPVRWRTEVPVSGPGPALASVGFWTLDVMLPANQKGTHMSRFVALLEAQAESPEPLDVPAFRRMLARMVELLDAPAGGIEVTFPFFMRKTAPVSGVESLMDYQVTVSGRVPAPVAPLAGGDGAPRTADDLARDAEMTLTVMVPVTSLCPCSKGISDYGAHNQRSHVTVQARLAADLSVESLIRRVEAQASCELWGLLKRPDEKYVTERAYDNPKFVEDLVRDVAGALKAVPAIASYVVEAENFESIHNHSAWARIASD